MTRRTLRLVAVGAATALIMAAPAGVGHADTPGPTPTPATPAPGPSSPAPATPPPAPTPTPSASPTPAPSATPTPTADPPRAGAQVEQAPALTLEVRSTFGNGTSFWSDIGAYAFRGSAPGLPDGSAVDLYVRSGTGGWRRLVSVRTADGAYAVQQPVGTHGTFTFVATTGGAPGSGEETSSSSVKVTVGNARVVFNRPVARTDALKDPRLTGSVVPARAGVTVTIDLLRAGRFVTVAQTRTDSRGRFALLFRHGHGRLAGYRIRAAYRVPNRAYWETARSHRIVRAAVLNAVVKPTTAADVATTYRGGCPVGPSRLRTVSMNFYGTDKRMHRGVMVIRTDLTGEVKEAFGRALGVRFPLARMRNPNAYGGNDPKQMRADNTSGFNCRKVVGNPYRQSPHSYGIAIDVNPRQNPYRDPTGRWWPENGTSYIDRTPRRGGMLSSRSTLVRALQADDFFWGGRWSPGRDYQHFQYQ